jgi:hypothetical protein
VLLTIAKYELRIKKEEIFSFAFLLLPFSSAAAEQEDDEQDWQRDSNQPKQNVANLARRSCVLR